jgi:hypothetical protein
VVREVKGIEKMSMLGSYWAWPTRGFGPGNSDRNCEGTGHEVIGTIESCDPFVFQIPDFGSSRRQHVAPKTHGSVTVKKGGQTITKWS